ncbi:MAG: carbamoyltransferase HypF [archaeon]|nr:carbamoyltransferase HypF [archaeon]
MSQKVRATIHVSGLVQGLGYRPFVYRLAIRYNLTGYVLNLGDAGVRIEIEGSEKSIKNFLKSLVEEKPSLVYYTDLRIDFKPFKAEFKDFKIKRSSIEAGGGLSYPAPDLATCKECVLEIFNSNTRFYLYPFTSCTNCGPRFSIIEELPYDRERTTMKDFPFCPECEKEYNYPFDRRFNAQTTCCPKCGPKYELRRIDGSLVDGDSIKEAARLLDEGFIIAIKGVGGFHLSADAYNEEAINELRVRRKKPQKPFAVMSSNLKEVMTFAHISNVEEQLLKSLMAPIALLRKKEPFPLAENVSPQLHNVGVMLPYSGIHHILFHYAKTQTLVMTSANNPDEPMIIENQEAFRRMKNIADYFLIHNRRIYMRCDDSVIKVVDEEPLPIRRSRGYTPTPLLIPLPFNSNVLAVGGEFMVTSCLIKKDKAFLSQHIGEVESLESIRFLEEAIDHLIKILKIESLDSIVIDLHPLFHTRKVAERFAKRFNAPLFEAQHHHSHLVSLMTENIVDPEDEIVAITCDGVGYGSDSSLWGGEILLGGYRRFERVASLEPHFMPGGDLSAIWYGRMLQSILYKVIERRELTNFLKASYTDGFKYGVKEIDVVFQQLEKRINTPLTTSTGRVLDALSCLLGVCFKRTYEGEGAMKLESIAIEGNDSMPLPFKTQRLEDREILITSDAFAEVKALLQKGKSRKHLAASFQRGLAEGLADIDTREAKEKGIKFIGFSGGVDYNEAMTKIIRKKVENENLGFLRHRILPCGDGGLALGQAVLGAAKLLVKGVKGNKKPLSKALLSP